MALTTSTKTLKTDKNSQQIRQKQSYIDATMSKFNEKNIFQNLSFFTILRLLGHLNSVIKLSTLYLQCSQWIAME